MVLSYKDAVHKNIIKEDKDNTKKKGWVKLNKTGDNSLLDSDEINTEEIDNSIEDIIFDSDHFSNLHTLYSNMLNTCKDGCFNMLDEDYVNYHSVFPKFINFIKNSVEIIVPEEKEEEIDDEDNDELFDEYNEIKY